MPAAGLAERLRQHRAEMELALQLGVTPAEARRELRRRANAVANEALRARRSMPIGPVRAQPRGVFAEQVSSRASDGDRAGRFWWMED